MSSVCIPNNKSKLSPLNLTYKTSYSAHRQCIWYSSRLRRRLQALRKYTQQQNMQPNKSDRPPKLTGRLPRKLNNWIEFIVNRKKIDLPIATLEKILSCLKHIRRKDNKNDKKIRVKQPKFHKIRMQKHKTKESINNTTKNRWKSITIKLTE